MSDLEKQINNLYFTINPLRPTQKDKNKAIEALGKILLEKRESFEVDWTGFPNPNQAYGDWLVSRIFPIIRETLQKNTSDKALREKMQHYRKVAEFGDGWQVIGFTNTVKVVMHNDNTTFREYCREQLDLVVAGSKEEKELAKRLKAWCKNPMVSTEFDPTKEPVIEKKLTLAEMSVKVEELSNELSELRNYKKEKERAELWGYRRGLLYSFGVTTQNPLEALDLPNTATRVDINRRAKEWVFMIHPDRNGGKQLPDHESLMSKVSEIKKAALSNLPE